MDAFYILQKAVDLISLPFPGAGLVWDFDPTQRAYTDLESDQTGQDFTAILLGDISGNWSAATVQGGRSVGDAPAVIRVEAGRLDEHGVVTATVQLEPGEAQVYGVDLTLAHDPDAAALLEARLGPAAQGWLLAVDRHRPGEIPLSMAGALPIAEDGELLTLTFRLVDALAGPTDLLLTRGEINEGAVRAHLVGDTLGGEVLYLPLILQADGGE
jgi:hypothetical protein